mgnify:CR=1 FL=1
MKAMKVTALAVALLEARGIEVQPTHADAHRLARRQVHPRKGGQTAGPIARSDIELRNLGAGPRAGIGHIDVEADR